MKHKWVRALKSNGPTKKEESGIIFTGAGILEVMKDGGEGGYQTCISYY